MRQRYFISFSFYAILMHTNQLSSPVAVHMRLNTLGYPGTKGVFFFEIESKVMESAVCMQDKKYNPLERRRCPIENIHVKPPVAPFTNID